MATLAFPARVDATSIADLTHLVCGHRGEDLTIDLAQTERLGGLGGQLLHSALKTWRDDGRVLTLSNSTDQLTVALERLGLVSAISTEEPRS
ncbi:MAG: STAS domain-containing protein [Caulobacteraceae bacterium]|nr:STAS domain-containing protein [Caulobacteraceae bacterium]